MKWCLSKIITFLALFYVMTRLIFYPVSYRGEICTNHSQEVKEKILVIGIMSKLNDFNRRSAIRFSWLKICTEREEVVVCKFFTDSIDSASNDTKTKIKIESDINGDMVFMPLKGGHNFGLRLVWMVNWFSQYSYKYFLRIDDDYFLCLDRLLYELPKRPDKGLYWGYIHCREHVVRVDEGWMILTRDIIDEALSKLNTTLQCHPYGDQAVALWIKDSKLNITYFLDNERVIHAATAFMGDKFMLSNICQNYLALHGAYPTQMLKYWILTESFDKKNVKKNYYMKNIPPFHTVCRYSKDFDWRWFYPHVKFEAKPCHTNPVWTITNEEFKGREDIGSEILF